MIRLLTVCKKQNALLLWHARHNYLCRIMEIYELIFTIFIIYLLYKLVFHVLVPVARVSSAVRDKMRHMQTDGTQQHNNNSRTPENKKNATTSTDSEYIDFEEIK